MGLRVNTNIASLASQRNLSIISGRLQGNYSRLSSGLRVSTAADDAAGLGISERMRSQIRSYSTAGRNAQDGISMVQSAEGALNEVSNILGRMRELAVQAASGTLSAADRTTIDTEFQALDDEINRIGVQTQFNGITLLNAAATTSIQVGTSANQTIDVVTADMRSAALLIDGLDTTSAANASKAIPALDPAIDTVTTQRGTFGSSVNRLQSAFNSIQNSHENLSAAESRIRDVDVAFETADLSRNTIMQQAATSILSQANQQPQLALSLLG
jgi:flagellin